MVDKQDHKLLESSFPLGIYKFLLGTCEVFSLGPGTIEIGVVGGDGRRGLEFRKGGAGNLRVLRRVLESGRQVAAGVADLEEEVTGDSRREVRKGGVWHLGRGFGGTLKGLIG